MGSTTTTNERDGHETREKDIPKDTRRVVLERDLYQCQYCGRSDRLELHHWLDFRSHQGGHEPENLVTVCHEHHGDIHAGRLDLMLYEVFPGQWYAFAVGRIKHTSSEVGNGTHTA